MAMQLTQEQKDLLKQLMNENPGIPLDKLMDAVLNAPEGEMAMEGTSGLAAGPAAPSVPMGGLLSDTPQVIAPEAAPTPAGPALCGPGTVWNGTHCVVAGQF